jgi:hypothetical protein
MRRRNFIKAIARSVAAWSDSARAQQAPLPLVSYLLERAWGRSRPQLTGNLR